MTFDREMMEALEADGEKLRQLTGEDHGPYFPDEYSTHDTDTLFYDEGRDGVWIGDAVFLPRNVIIRALGLLPENPPA